MKFTSQPRKSEVQPHLTTNGSQRLIRSATHFTTNQVRGATALDCMLQCLPKQWDDCMLQYLPKPWNDCLLQYLPKQRNDCQLQYLPKPWNEKLKLFPPEFAASDCQPNSLQATACDSHHMAWEAHRQSMTVCEDLHKFKPKCQDATAPTSPSPSQ